ncbi:MAG: MgtC/SapB family protein [Planctomycetota bacterium]
MITEKEILVRVSLAFLTGVVVGLDRESHGRTAGLRTMILVCVAAALGMILSEQLAELNFVPEVAWRADPGRLAAGMLTGIGFLGAGTIMRQEHVVRGVTTAAMLWFVTVLGLAFGGGKIFLGLIGLGIALLTLIGISVFEKYLKSDWYGHVTITAEFARPTEESIKQQLQRLGAALQDLDLDYDTLHQQRTMTFAIRVRPAEVFKISQEVVQHFSKEPGVLQVKWT